MHCSRSLLSLCNTLQRMPKAAQRFGIGIPSTLILSCCLRLKAIAVHSPLNALLAIQQGQIEMPYIATIACAGKHHTIVQSDLSGLHRRARKAMNKLLAREAARSDCMAPEYTDRGTQSAFYGNWGMSLAFETFSDDRHFEKRAGYSITYRPPSRSQYQY